MTELSLNWAMIFTIIFIVFLLLAALNFFIPFVRPIFKGKVGELTVHLHKKIDLDDQYLLLNDLTLPDDQGSTTQVDHVLLSIYGVFVIETKNYKGWIFGGERQKMWTQKLYKKSFRFQNPLHQNYKHLKVLQELLGDLAAPACFHSLVVFMPDAEFKTPMPKNVFRGRAWTDYVKTFDQQVISEITLERMQLRLEKEVLERSWKTNRIHVQNLKKRHE